ncbi:AAA family ATPase [Desulfosporosinus sp. BICA1-9]|uniref:AAA family ATPase n=1 Tax=Desulfosporosinus sp. BICA1-9 TaxID=1531958 RepID=UPI00054B74DA|nr:AAA family ATPase [Desulfosporosinus sp. BICA1-9]KJS48687.1 MAG: ATPase AAA [Peptococcaceae bacterium BRH_c23]KJS90495.1 MAG: ATPase AAA [Desulfosporosinus sp. BICA1-9]HBW38419.1 AAA family ATPase [Desulfosporosinus sp.]
MESRRSDQYIRSVRLNRAEVPTFTEYPFDLAAIRNLETLSFHPQVTFIVGENGSGKSTILESIAVAYGFNAEGGTKNFNFSSKATHSNLNQYIRLVKGLKSPEDGFFLRAESFYNLATNIDKLDSEPSFGPPLINFYGGRSLHEQSHGESFFAVFQNKFRGKGIYILDEPEAALSPSRQMSMITRLHELVHQGSQFIIATHSPIIMAYPQARIYQIQDGFKIVKYEEIEHYQIMRAFMNNTQKMLDILMELA